MTIEHPESDFVKGADDYVRVSDLIPHLDAETLPAVEAAARADGLIVGGEWLIQGWRLQEVLASRADDLAKVLRSRFRAEPVDDLPEGQV
jgi:hypothetical protein